ncbi:alpha/beta fold hydrolase [Streptomyces sp. NPDC092369]|uniref:alpha/beta fold hydrolase n=1 Tax=Streptomyces sp. NPDC092369 TaxID=3366015 RepID=UPI00382CA4C3
MADVREHVLDGVKGRLVVREWPREHPRYIALVLHGYGEHIGRYGDVAGVLVRHGGVVLGPDHAGHGRSAGARVLIEDFEDVVTDAHAVADLARSAYPGLPVVLVGHSMGGLIAARYTQRYGDELAALVLSGPVIGDWTVPDRLPAHDEIPDTPINPAALSRDPAVGAAYAADPLVWSRPTAPLFDTVSRVCANASTVGRFIGPCTNRAEVFADLSRFLDEVLITR